MKSPLKSKTVWFNVLTLAAGVCAYIAGAPAMADYATVVPIFIAIQGALNIVLRFVTTEPIS